jgi:hypothetical protein
MLIAIWCVRVTVLRVTTTIPKFSFGSSGSRPCHYKVLFETSIENNDTSRYMGNDQYITETTGITCGSIKIDFLTASRYKRPMRSAAKVN